ncbi:unnamed protein product [Phytophthora fragariaefolia]|uniref:Unnamed protein product n=1 Tax=Phytophthora fragariaefolia TaxID=1490495 RepID=A0A9W7D5C1_9STRA|nr:unnamed protein product [Phytophthora fragariaefolia]
MLTPDRIGDHLVDRCMALDDFRVQKMASAWLPEALTGSRMNFGSCHVLQGIVNAVNDQVQAIIAYENEPNALVKLAQTGYIAQQILRLNRLLDVALAAYGISEPRGIATWQTVFQQERQERMMRFQNLVENKPRLLELLGGEQQQLEVLTLLVYDFQKHSDDTYTDMEYDVILNVYEICARFSGLAVINIPEWFVPSYEIEQSHWQGTQVDVEYLSKPNDEFCIRQASAWWDLHHPHVMKLFGVCHVGKAMTLVRERAQCVKKPGAELPSRDVLVGTAHVLQFLHERHIIPANLSLERLFSTEKEHKVMLHGGELHLKPVTSPAVNLKKQGLSGTPFLPACPDFLKNDEWGFIKQACVDDLNIRDGVSYVINRLQERSRPAHRHFWNRKAYPHKTSGIVKYTQSYVDPSSNQSVGSLFEEITDRFNSNEGETTLMDGYVLERLVSVHQQLLSSICTENLLRSFIEIIVRFKQCLVRRAESNISSFCVALSRSIEHISVSFHAEIDDLVARCGFAKTETTSTHDWKRHCNFLRLNQHESFQVALEGLVSDLGEEEERIEAATLLVFEATKHRCSYDCDQLRAIESTAANIVGIPGDQKHIVVPKWFIPRYEVDVGTQISTGSFAAVHHGKWLNATVAIKCLFQSDRKLFMREANIWFTLNHPNIVKLYGACHVGKCITSRSLDEPEKQANRRPFFVCEYASEGTLNDYLKKSEIRHKSGPNVWKCLCEAARGLQHLHERGIIHGDLKGNNILVGSDRQVKLTDFGLSAFAKKLNWTGRTGAIGAIRWKAPERLGKFDRGPSFASDIYSFGMCIIEAVTGTFPWRETVDEDVIVSNVTQGKLPSRPETFTNEQWDLVSRMCRLNPADRVTTAAVVALLGSFC